MNQDKYIRTIQDLEKVGAKWWPDEVKNEAANNSMLQYLLNTQDKFISLLTLAEQKNEQQLFDIIEASDFPLHLFLKHLMILTDVGSEQLQRFNTSLQELCPGNSMIYEIEGQKHSYSFCALPVKGTPNNKKLHIDTLEALKKTCKTSGLCKDFIMLLLYGALSVLPKAKTVFCKCNVGQLLGKRDKMKTFVKQSYIRVSRIVGGNSPMIWATQPKLML